MNKKNIPVFSKLEKYDVLYFKNNKPINSKYANYFHDELLKNTGIEVLASDAHYCRKQLQITLWIQDNEKSEIFMEGRFCCMLNDKGDKVLKNSIFDCLISVAKKFKFNLLEREPPKIENEEIDLTLVIYIRSLPMLIKLDILHASISPITKMFKEQYPQYNVICLVGTEKFDYTDEKHMFLFFKFREIDTAMSNGDLERMREEAYKILQTYDTDHLITQEDYTPFIKSRDRYSSMDLRSLFDINDGVF